MKHFIAILMLFSANAFVTGDIDSTVTRYTSEVNFDGTYGFDIAQSNGAEFKETGYAGHYANGAYQYYSPEGELVQVTYRADENGFQPESIFIPKPPPIPDYILRAIKYIQEHPTPEELADQQVRATQI